jgi:fatty acid desaturase
MAISAQQIQDLREELRAAGVLEKRPVITWVKLFAHLGVGIALSLLCIRLPFWAVMCVTPFASVIYVVGVMMGHDGGHRSAFHSRLANAALRHIAFPLASGMSGIYWQYRHNVLHHAHPNVIERDEDIELHPLAQGRCYYITSHPAWRWIQRNVQGPFFWFFATGLPLDLRLKGFRYLVSHARTRRIDIDFVTDVAAIAVHFLCWIVIPCIWLPPLHVVGFYLYFWTIGGLWLSMLGLSGHGGLPLIDCYDDPTALIFHTTRNIRLGTVTSWCFVGLDYQIEHHMFPDLPSFQIHKSAPFVRRFAQRNGFPYHEIGFWGNLVALTRYFTVAWDDPGHNLVGNKIEVAEDRPARLFRGRIREPGTQREVRIGGERGA